MGDDSTKFSKLTPGTTAGDTAYLDIETNWDRQITVIGIHHEVRGTVQLVRPHITREGLLSALEGIGRIVTYGGATFDLPCIHRALGVDLMLRYMHLDLQYPCRKKNLKGGLKRVEVLLGIHRDSEGMTGLDALRLWQEYEAGSQEALEALLRYNRDDIENLPIIERKVAAHTP